MQIERVTDEAVLEAIYRLRVSAWRARVPEFPEMERWSDAFDGEALHWAAFDRGRPVAAARLTVHDTTEEAPDGTIYRKAFPRGLPEPFGVFTRLCVAPSHAGLGLARMLDDVRFDYAQRLGCSCVVGITTAGTPRAGDMAARGFEAIVGTVTYREKPLAVIGNKAMILMMRRIDPGGRGG